MNNLPSPVQSTLHRLQRRIAVAQFLQIWPSWGIAAFLLAGSVVLVSKIFFPQAAGLLVWLWFLPLLSAVPAAVLAFTRRYTASEIAVLADSLSGGNGTLLAALETGSSAWNEKLAITPLPRFRIPRQVWPLAGAGAFLIAALLLPQRVLTVPGNEVAATEIAADLKATVAKLKEQELITPEEEKKLDEEIERIRKSAMQRMDSSTWDAADAFREKAVADLSEKHDALKWAQESLARYSVAAQAGDSNVEAEAQELAKAIEKLAQSGLLADAPMELQKMLGSEFALSGGKVRLPTDPGSLRRVSEMLSSHLAERQQSFTRLSALAKEFGRFDPSEYPEFNNERGPDSDGSGDPGTGGINRGRGDAELTWGKETPNFDKFKPTPLPPGAVRSPDDWAPAAVLPGAPKTSPELSVGAQARQYGTGAGQAGWRRTLAPRHSSAVKKYFENKR